MTAFFFLFFFLQLSAPSPGGVSIAAGLDSGGRASTDDPLDLKGSVGNLCLSLRLNSNYCITLLCHICLLLCV